jgi:RNA polymerase sigma factor (sigma-70 family)
MTTRSDGVEPSPKPGGWFATTHWSVVLAAGDPACPQAAEALEKLCRTYWYPLYAFVRRRGYSPEDAEDLTQEFLARLLAKDFLRGVGPRKGRFRTFLLACLDHFLIDTWDKLRAVRRGGGQTPLSLDARAAEQRYRLEPADELTAEALYERRWANTILEQVIDRLRQEYVAAGNGPRFDHLQDLLLGEHPSLTYAAVASCLGTTEGAVKMAISRLRQRFREVLREEIAHTVVDPSEVDEEIRHLRATLRN